MSKYTKKKKTRNFEIYISKVLKQVSPSNGITSNSKQQLNSVICIIAKEISKTVLQLTEISKKRTISYKEIENATKLIFTGELANNSIKEGNKSVNNFNTQKCKGSRQNKAGIIFSPSICEKFLRNFGYSKIMVSSSAPIFLAAILEYITAEILELSSQYCKTNKRIRITIRDIQLSIDNDIELSNLFNKLNISLLGGGVLPFIHPVLNTKKTRKTRKINDFVPINLKKTHRFRPGTVALREIKKYQKTSNCITLSKLPFERFVRNIVNIYNPNMKISKDVFIVLQYFIEQYTINILRDANMAAIHTGRVKLMNIDISLICNLYKIQLSNTLKIVNDENNENNENDEKDEKDEKDR